MSKEKVIRGTITPGSTSRGATFEARMDVDTTPIKTKLTGDRWTFLVASIMALTFTTCVQGSGIYEEIQKSNAIEQEKLELLRQQVQAVQRQYTLDSLRFQMPYKNR